MAVGISFKVTENTANRVLGKLSKGIPTSIAKSISLATTAMQSSAVGLVPTRTRLLLRSIRRVARPTFGVVGVQGPEPVYARFVEFGTKHMKAQPYILPAFNRARRRHFSANTVLRDLNL